MTVFMYFHSHIPPSCPIFSACQFMHVISPAKYVPKWYSLSCLFESVYRRC